MVSTPTLTTYECSNNKEYALRNLISFLFSSGFLQIMKQHQQIMSLIWKYSRIKIHVYHMWMIMRIYWLLSFFKCIIIIIINWRGTMNLKYWLSFKKTKLVKILWCFTKEPNTKIIIINKRKIKTITNYHHTSTIP